MKWEGRSDKVIVKLRKINVQVEFRKKMGLVIDQPSLGGAGTYDGNDGNTAKRVFQ